MKKFTYKLNKNLIQVTISDCYINLHLNGQTYFATYWGYMEDVEKDLIDAMVFILFYGLGENRLAKYDTRITEVPAFMDSGIALHTLKQRERYGNIIVSFSAGVDSSALLTMLPRHKLFPVFLDRSYDKVYTANQLRMINHMATPLTIPNDFERIRMDYGRPHGFNIGIGYAALLIPLVDKLRARHIVFGSILDDTGFYYKDELRYGFNLRWSRSRQIFDILREIGVALSFPMAGLSEIHTVRRVAESAELSLASSCHVPCNTSCMACYKCFRKQGILGKQLDMTNPAIEKRILQILRKKPLKMASSTVYGIQKARYLHPFFERYHKLDVDFLHRVDMDLARFYNDDQILELMEREFYRMGLCAMTSYDYGCIKIFCDEINEPKLYHE